MSVPIVRRYTTTVPGALNTPTPSIDDVTQLTIQQLNRSNTIEDWVN
jgi:hypothetical protein